MTPWYKEYSDLLAEYFSGKVQKISVDIGNSCPNRDGTKGRGGCIYCSNSAFSPDFEKRTLDVTEQLKRGKDFFRYKYPNMKYLAYFQSYTSTYGDLKRITEAMEAALSQPDVVGLVLGTRPDCIGNELLETAAELKEKYHAQIFIELGAESSHNSTLAAINRCHSWEDTVDAVHRCHNAGFPVGLHLIMYLPGEDKPMMRTTVERVCQLPVCSIKFHQLQLIKGTPMAAMVRDGKLEIATPATPEEYAAFIAELIPLIPKHIALDRFTAQAPPESLIYPQWGLKNHEFTAILHRILKGALTSE